MTATKPSYPILEAVARAMFRAERIRKTGNPPPKEVADANWPLFACLAQAAIDAMQLEGK